MRKRRSYEFQKANAPATCSTLRYRISYFLDTGRTDSFKSLVVGFSYAAFTPFYPA